VVLELQPVADDFVEAEVHGNGTNREIQRSRHKHVTVAEISRAIDERFGLGKNRRLEGHFEQIVCQTDEAIPMHAFVGSEREDIEKRRGNRGRGRTTAARSAELS
jgi:hypothetical protein